MKADSSRRFVLDCSVAMGWTGPIPSTSYPREVLIALRSSSAIVPAVWPLEVCNALLVLRRRNLVTDPDIAHYLRILRGMRIYVDLAGQIRKLDSLFALAEEFSLTSYDASYLQLARKSRLPLATLDKKLRTAAANAGVKLFLPA